MQIKIKYTSNILPKWQVWERQIEPSADMGLKREELSYMLLA